MEICTSGASLAGYQQLALKFFCMLYQEPDHNDNFTLQLLYIYIYIGKFEID